MIEMHTSTAMPGAPGPWFPAHDADAFDRLVVLPPALAIQQALPLVRHLAGAFVHLLPGERPLSPRPDSAREPQVIEQVTTREGAWWLGYFLWAPGATTPIHDHTSWGVYVCARGMLLEERYRRLDSYSRPQRAHLRASERRRLGVGDCSTLLPFAGGIHRVTNLGAAPAWSIHLYGPRLGPLDGRDYDPARDYVCDRWV